jgi:6-phosphogluconolactonase
MTRPVSSPAGRDPWHVRRFASLAQASAALSARIVGELERAITARGEASLALPGGATPRELLLLLGYRSLDWRRVHVTLTDERWVGPDHARSNAGQVERLMLRGARGARWFPLWRNGLSASQAMPVLEAESAALPWPLDVIVLGMGEDGHVASLFPGDDTGFASRGRRYVAVEGPAAEPRMSLTAEAICSSRAAFLMVGGRRKLEVLDGARARGLPVARVLEGLGERAGIYAGD